MSDEGLMLALALEACMVLFLVVFLLRNDRQKSRDRDIVSDVIKGIKKNKSTRKDDLKDVFELSEMGQGELENLLDEIHNNESRLYQHVVKIFLQKEVEHLKVLDQHVSSLSEPYWKALKELSEKSAGSAANQETIEQLQAGLKVSLQEKERMSDQLGMALKTLDEVSGEYTQMFDGGAGLNELNQSKQRMIDFFDHVIGHKAEEDEGDEAFDPLERMESI